MDMPAKRFSEVMWFKHGDAEELEAPGESDQPAPAYEDDGSLSADDVARYNLRTGRTEPIAALRDAPPPTELAPARARTMQLALVAMAAVLAIGLAARLFS
jgi:hypothetical protein